jgi:ribonuclease P protein component
MPSRHFALFFFPTMARFPKRERLCRKKTIGLLFGGGGESFARHPVRFVWKVLPLAEPVTLQVAFSVSKKNFKRAHQRNLLKRRLREAWRLHKGRLEAHVAAQGGQAAFMVIFQGKEEADFATIEKKMADCVRFFCLNVRLKENSE